MNDALTTALIVAFIGFLFWRAAVSMRDTWRDPDERFATLTGIVLICATVPACLLIDRVTGKSPLSPEPSYAIRRASFVVAAVVWIAFLWRRIGRRHAEERARFLREREESPQGNLAYGAAAQLIRNACSIRCAETLKT